MRRTQIAALAIGVLAAGLVWHAVDAPPTVDVEWSGCNAELTGPVCEVEPSGSLTVWVPDAAHAECGRVELRLDDRVVDVEGVDTDAGRRYRLAPGEADSLSLHLCDHGSPSWALPLRPRSFPAALDAVDTLRRRDPTAALKSLEHLHLEEPFASVALGIRARILAATRGIDEARADFEAAIVAQTNQGRVSDACGTRLAFVYFLIEASDLGHAERVLSGGQECLRSSPKSRALWPYYETLLSLGTSNLKRALVSVDRAIRRQTRLGMNDRLPFAEELRARVFERLGRFDEAAAILSRPTSGECQSAILANRLGWLAIVAREAGHPLLEPDRIEATLERALEGAPACGSASQLEPFVWLNLALAGVAASDAIGAENALRSAKRSIDGDRARADPWLLEIAGHVARLRGRPDDALQNFASLDRLGTLRVDEDVRWRAALGRARTYEDEGAHDAAIVAYERAESAVDRALDLVPFGEGRASFVEARSPSTTRLLELLVRRRQYDEAGVAARRSLRRGLKNLTRASRLAALDSVARARWSGLLGEYQRTRTKLRRGRTTTWHLTAAEVTRLEAKMAESQRALRDALEVGLVTRGEETVFDRPKSGELLLVLHPLLDSSLGVFAIDHEVTRFHRVERLDVEAASDVLSQLLLEPFRQKIEAASTVLVLVPGTLATIDFHALPWGDATLGLGRSVLYTLDLGIPRSPVSPVDRVLLSRDGTGTLRNTDTEEREIRAKFEVTTVDETTALAALVRRLEKADHFHHAGHGTFAGPDGLEAGLTISDDLRLTTTAILSLRHAPTTVVLAGCDLARTEPLSTTLTLGAGQAFVVRGSQRVVAAVRPVRDVDAVQFSTHFYAALAEGFTFERAVGRAQEDLKRTQVDWAAFRIFVP